MTMTVFFFIFAFTYILGIQTHVLMFAQVHLSTELSLDSNLGCYFFKKLV